MHKAEPEEAAATVNLDSGYKECEIEAINELKKKFKGKVVGDMYEDDRFFYRFLKARNFNSDNAEDMLRKHLEYRKKYDVDNIMNYKEPEVLEKFLPFVPICHDKEGSVVRYTPAGNIDWIGIHLSVKHEDFVKALILDFEEDIEEHKKQSRKLGKIIDKNVYIYDLDKLTFAQVTNKKVILNLIYNCVMYQDNYPERCKAIFIINASTYFSYLFPILKSILAGEVLDKIKVYSDDSYKEDLLKMIDADVLPAFLGGNKTDPDGDPFCPSFIGRGGPVPESCYIHKSKRSLAALPGVERVKLTKASFHEVEKEVKIPGSYLEWEFEIKSRDVGFGLFYKEIVNEEEKMVQLVPLQRTDTDDYAEHGMFRCEKAGTYVVVFDNTYSWIRTKEVYYRIQVVAPDEQEDILAKK